MVYAVCDIGKALGAYPADVLKQIRSEYLAVQGGNAVYLIARGEAEVCHVHLSVADYEVSADLLAVAEAGDEVVAPAAVYLAQYLPHARQKRLHELLRPFFERLAHDGVVRVRDRCAHRAPRLVPAETVLVHHDAHELGDDQRGVGVVYLNGVVLCKALDVAEALHVGLYYRLRRCRQEEILLLEAQGLALDVVVRGIKHLGDDLAHGALLKALDIFALGEQVHIQCARAARVPEPEDVDVIPAVAGNEHIARDRGDGLIAGVLGVISSEAVPARGDVAAEAHFDRLVVSRNEPAFRRAAPIVGDLGLLSVNYLLAEYAQLVAKRISRCGNAERRQRVHIARGEAAETAVAESCVVFRLEYIRGAASHVLKRARKSVGNAEVERIFHKAASHKELHRKIVHLALGGLDLLGGEQPAHDFTNDDGACLKHLIVACCLCCHGKVRAKLILNGAAHLVARDLTYIHKLFAP